MAERERQREESVPTSEEEDDWLITVEFSGDFGGVADEIEDVEEAIFFKDFDTSFAHGLDLILLQHALSFPRLSKGMLIRMLSFGNSLLDHHDVGEAETLTYGKLMELRRNIPPMAVAKSGTLTYLPLRHVIEWIISIDKYRNILSTRFERR